MRVPCPGCGGTGKDRLLASLNDLGAMALDTCDLCWGELTVYVPQHTPTPFLHGPDLDPGKALLEALRLAERFPARHNPTLTYPKLRSVPPIL